MKFERKTRRVQIRWKSYHKEHSIEAMKMFFSFGLRWKTISSSRCMLF